MHTIIDGNNLLFAMRARGHRAELARETLLRMIESWAGRAAGEITVVFDGAAPTGNIARQLESQHLTVRFSQGCTADDVIVDMLYASHDPAQLRIVSDDKAILHEAARKHASRTKASAFVAELYQESPDSDSAESGTGRGQQSQSPTGTQSSEHGPATEKPGDLSREQSDEWLREFGYDPDEDDEPFDGWDAMMH